MLAIGHGDFRRLVVSLQRQFSGVRCFWSCLRFLSSHWFISGPLVMMLSIVARFRGVVVAIPFEFVSVSHNSDHSVYPSVFSAFASGFALCAGR